MVHDQQSRFDIPEKLPSEESDTAPNPDSPLGLWGWGADAVGGWWENALEASGIGG